jgi:hypothetical protein
LIEFISAAFSGEVTFRKARPDGAIMHAEMRIGDSMLMVADSTEQFAPTTSSIYLYVADCDAVYQSALRAGGVSVFPNHDFVFWRAVWRCQRPMRQRLVGCHTRRVVSTLARACLIFNVSLSTGSII